MSGLIGQVGELPTNAPPVLLGLSGLGLGVPGVSLTAPNLAWGYCYTLERSADLLAWTNSPPPTPRTRSPSRSPPTPRASSYRLRSP